MSEKVDPAVAILELRTRHAAWLKVPGPRENNKEMVVPGRLIPAIADLMEAVQIGQEMWRWPDKGNIADIRYRLDDLCREIVK